MAGDAVHLPSPALPRDGLLAEAARALHEGKHWAWVVDPDWQLVFVSGELRSTFGYDPPLPTPYLGTPWTDDMLASPFGSNSVDFIESHAGTVVGGLMLTDLGRSAVREHVDPRLVACLDDVEPVDGSLLPYQIRGVGVSGRPVEASGTAIRIRDRAGRLAGTVLLFKPTVGMTTLASLAMNSDPDYLERVQRVGEAARRPAGILFADLEGSSPLARRLPTASYFKLTRRVVRATDHHVVAFGGLVGRHVGDGVAAFFLADTAGSESAAAAACVAAARSVRNEVPDIARSSGLDPSEVVVRMGLHWGTTLYVGNITSEGRSEVTAMGDEVNEAARIEACATGGRVLASKNLIERLDPGDAAHLGIDPAQTNYTALADLPYVSDKARRDAPTLAVCEIDGVR